MFRFNGDGAMGVRWAGNNFRKAEVFAENGGFGTYRVIMDAAHIRLNRRGFLRGLGAAVAIPAMESLRPLSAAPVVAGRAVTASGAPLRMAYLYLPNGVNVEKWRPEGTGTAFKFGESTSLLEPYRGDLQVVKGLAQLNAAAGPDGAGDHARSSATFLTGVRARKTAGADIKLGMSVDQMAARYLQHETRFPSLELSCDGVRKSGSCDSGYSCAYQFNISWKSETQPVAPESNPRLVFERLFGSGGEQERKESLARRREEQRSVLDFVLEDARAMQKELGRNDQQKLDEYLTGVRDIERRIEMAERVGPVPDPGVAAPPEGIPGNYQEHIRLMFDMLVLAFKTDSTRVATYLLAHEGSNRSFNEIGVAGGHHELSHHAGSQAKLEKIAKIDRFYLQQLTYFLDRMKGEQDIDGQSLLHNSMIVWGSGIGDGNKHNHNDLPVIVAGNAGGKFTTGRHLDVGEDVPMTNLYLRMLEEMGMPEARVGDSTGILKGV